MRLVNFQLGLANFLSHVILHQTLAKKDSSILGKYWFCFRNTVFEQLVGLSQLVSKWLLNFMHHASLWFQNEEPKRLLKFKFLYDIIMIYFNYLPSPPSPLFFPCTCICKEINVGNDTRGTVSLHSPQSGWVSLIC